MAARYACPAHGEVVRKDRDEKTVWAMTGMFVILAPFTCGMTLPAAVLYPAYSLLTPPKCGICGGTMVRMGVA